MRVVGLMSGTSLDGIDAVLAGIDGAPGAVEWRIDAFVTVPYSDDRRALIYRLLTGDPVDHTLAAAAPSAPAAVGRLHALLGEWLADAALAVCREVGVDPADVDVIGSHGQTVWHEPPPAERPFTLQLGDAATIAERTGIPVVADFRARDVAAGGHGAPLVPWVDAQLFAADAPRALVNIGGMANVTRVPARGSDESVVAFDTGPGNAILDAAVSRATDGALAYDANGEWARRGRVDDDLAAELLADPWFRRPPPKSTGRERFGRAYVDALVARRVPADRDGWAALVATLTEVVARSIADGIRCWASPASERAPGALGEGGEVIVTGGGAENPVLMEALARELDPVPVRGGDALGIDPGAKEALAFAVLAWAHVRGIPANVPAATGAAGPRVLGSLTPGRNGRLPERVDTGPDGAGAEARP